MRTLLLRKLQKAFPFRTRLRHHSVRSVRSNHHEGRFCKNRHHAAGRLRTIRIRPILRTTLHIHQRQSLGPGNGTAKPGYKHRARQLRYHWNHTENPRTCQKVFRRTDGLGAAIPDDPHIPMWYHRTSSTAGAWQSPFIPKSFLKSHHAINAIQNLTE